MNKLLPKSKSNKQSLPTGQKGFTLVELLVVIVILAILGVVGVTLFTGTQQKARDAKRKEDINAIAAAMEANYVAGTGYTTTISSTWFADQQIPKNPLPGGSDYASTGFTTAGYTLCAGLEGTPKTGNATGSTAAGLGTVTNGDWFCKKNAQ